MWHQTWNPETLFSVVRHFGVRDRNMLQQPPDNHNWSGSGAVISHCSGTGVAGAVFSHTQLRVARLKLKLLCPLQKKHKLVVLKCYKISPPLLPESALKYLPKGETICISCICCFLQHSIRTLHNGQATSTVITKSKSLYNIFIVLRLCSILHKSFHILYFIPQKYSTPQFSAFYTSTNSTFRNQHYIPTHHQMSLKAVSTYTGVVFAIQWLQMFCKNLLLREDNQMISQ